MNDIQKHILDIFKEIAKICKANDIDYYALGGTCIGAVRHSGFIPWDDDLDIAIPIEQFDTFLAVAKRKLPEYLKIVTPYESRHNPLFFIKVINVNTTMIERCFIDYPDMYGGVWLDIFPLAGIPKERKKRNTFYHKGIWLERINKKTSLKFNIEKSICGKVAWLIFFPFRLLPKGYLWKKWKKELAKYPLKESVYTGHVWESKMTYLTFPSEFFLSYIEFPFEDTVIRCPKGYHEYLTQFFGDYMKLPPVEMQNSGHDFDGGIIDLKNSFQDYRK
ncbi:MAG: LicD family protein [Lachnospiraceae bacterium]|nr:LicD family protein [Lachnospiraceae bacterium]